MKIRILGTGCARCKTPTAKTEQAVRDPGLKAEVEKVTAIRDTMKFQILKHPIPRAWLSARPEPSRLSDHVAPVRHRRKPPRVGAGGGPSRRTNLRARKPVHQRGILVPFCLRHNLVPQSLQGHRDISTSEQRKLSVFLRRRKPYGF